VPREFSNADALLAAVGVALGETDWLEIHQDRIDRFAEATGDRQWIHVDVERAKQGPFGTPIAHGYLTLSLVTQFLPELVRVPSAKMTIHCGCKRVRFSTPVPVGTRIRGSAEVLEAEPVPGGVQLVTRVSVEVENGSKPACVADTVSRFLF